MVTTAPCVLLSIRLAQPLVHVSQAEATAPLPGPPPTKRRGQARPPVGDSDQYLIAMKTDTDGQVYAAVGPPAVPHRVFYQRLEDQAGHGHAQGLRGDLAGDAQPLAEAGPLNLQIAVQERQFLFHRHQPPLAAGQHVAKHLGQSLDRRFGPGRIGVSQCRDGIERVEEKMRVDLGFERRQFRLGRQRPQPLLLPLFLLQLAVEAQGHLGAVDDREHDHHATYGNPSRGGHDFEAKNPATDEQGQQRAQDVFEQRERHLQSQVQPVTGQLLQAGVEECLVQPVEDID